MNPSALPTSFDEYTPQLIAALMFDERQTISTKFWRNFFMTRTIQSEQAEIRFDEIDASRRIAPFMLPNDPGRPIYRGEGSRIRVFRPAYTKPKDPIDPADHVFETAEEVSKRIMPMTAPQRMAVRMVKIARSHRESIERLWDYMVAKALVDGKLDVLYVTDTGTEEFTTIDYGREAANTIDYAASHDWSTATFDIFEWIEERVNQVANTKFGGKVSDILMGTKAATQFTKFFRDPKRTKSGHTLLDRDTRGADDVMVRRGLIRDDPMNPFTYLGSLDSSLMCWKVQGPGNEFENDDYGDDESKKYSKVIGDWDVVFTSGRTEMILAFGAIIDEMMLMPTQMFSKTWSQPDPSRRFIMTQSAPMAIPVYPNGTLKATVGNT